MGGAIGHLSDGAQRCRVVVVVVVIVNSSRFL